MPNGSSEELQIVPQEVLEANRQEHHDYKKVRNAELAGRSADQARAAARAINDSAMERFNSRNSAADRVVKGPVVKGARVRLAGGALARVVYVDPNMRIARVRTEDGRNITVRHKDLAQGLTVACRTKDGCPSYAQLVFCARCGIPPSVLPLSASDESGKPATPQSVVSHVSR